MIVWLNIMPAYYKEQCMGLTGNVRANQMLYTLATGEPGEVSAVVLYTDGKEGAYNRANRAVAHFLENSLEILICLPLGFLCFPFPTFVIPVIFSLARIVYQFGYVKGFGWHYFGFWPDRITTFAMIGLLWWAYMCEPKDLTMEEAAAEVAAAAADMQE